MTIFYVDGLFPKRITRNTTTHDAYISEHKEISTAIIAFNLGVTERFIIQRQRKLSLRKLTSPNANRKGKSHESEMY